jgi:ribosomal protein S20
MWKKRIKNAVRTVSDIISAKPANADILKVELSKLQKTLDKAVKKEVIHRNKANRIKSKYAKKFSVQNSATEPKAKKTTSAKRGKSSK